MLTVQGTSGAAREAKRRLAPRDVLPAFQIGPGEISPRAEGFFSFTVYRTPFS